MINMPKGQSTMIWFPELKNILKTQWEFSLNIQEHFDLMNILNDELNKVRKDLNVKPPKYFCKHCNERHESVLNMVTITSMYFALERFDIFSHKEHLELKRNWRKYSNQNSINIHGKPIEEKKHESITPATCQ